MGSVMSNKEKLTADDFPATNVNLCFEDGSHVFFRYAFMVISGKTVNVYTEHCGYHKFYKPSLISFHGEIREKR